MSKTSEAANGERRCSVNKGVLKNFVNLTEKHLCLRLFLIKLQADLKLPTALPYLFKRNYNTGVFPVKFVKFLRATI